MGLNEAKALRPDIDKAYRLYQLYKQIIFTGGEIPLIRRQADRLALDFNAYELTIIQGLARIEIEEAE